MLWHAGAPADTSAFYIDARGLQDAINRFDLNNFLSPTNLQYELQVDVYWLGLMAKDAPPRSAARCSRSPLRMLRRTTTSHR